MLGILYTALPVQQITPPIRDEPDGLFKIMDIISGFYSTGIDDHLTVAALIAIIVLDIVLGVSRAWAFHKFSSSKFRKGFVGHASMVVIVAFAYPFAVYMNLETALDAFIFAMIMAYGASILANLSALGVRIPYLDNIIRKNIDKDKFDINITDYTSERKDKDE